MHACEHLIAATRRAEGSPLSQDEVQMVEAYAIEIQKILQQSSNHRS